MIYSPVLGPYLDRWNQYADNLCSVYIAGSVLKKLLATFPDKVDGQEAIANKKAELLYSALEAHSDVYKIVPDKSARSRMNICFRVTKVSAASSIKGL